jgi:hypothetical protein
MEGTWNRKKTEEVIGRGEETGGGRRVGKK